MEKTIKITEDYVSFEIAKLLKRKGFDIPNYASMKVFRGNIYEVNGEWITPKEDAIIPTIQMAMKWLRKHSWIICIIPLTFYCGEVVSEWGYNIWADDNLEIDEDNTPKFKSYEEAAEAAIKYCLENLI